MSPRVIALSGGIGGAKLVLGLAQEVEGEDLMVIANTGDDFVHCGFHISPDIDTLLYTLAGLSDRERGWGLAGETWEFMARLGRERPEDAWFQLGDKDLETHRLRTAALESGASLTGVTAELARHFGVGTAILPMSDDPVRTFVRTGGESTAGWLPFQEYFVKHRCEPVLHEVAYRGADQAAPQPMLGALDASRLEAVLIGPSNPFLSIDPILSIPGLRARLRDFGVPVVAVSPIVGGQAIKGPTAKIMRELGMPVDVVSVGRHYRGLIDALVIDEADRSRTPEIEALGLAVRVAPTVMVSLRDRVDLARTCLRFAEDLAAT
ncbi:2-phospho-L-lactate transferase [Elongatibacter sediminis]|uniref:2-phospho-L-lactate transferase n=1 Tax=Elongatibacter sediminis TaxID=3119006 RepID=A0AAW9RK32_9GAMM